MKKYLFSLIVGLSLIGFSLAPVQAQIQCDVIGPDNADTCCVGINPPAACADYININAGGDTQGGGPQGTVGSGGGGSINTNPTNSGSDTSSGTIAPTPQASSAALFACNTISFESLLDILIWLKCVIGAAIIPLLFTIAFLLFLWGMIKYIRGSDDVKKREESKKFIYWGIIGLTVMVSVWGIVKIVNSTFGFGNTVPELQTDYLKKN